MSWRRSLRGEDTFPFSPYHKPASSVNKSVCTDWQHQMLLALLYKAARKGQGVRHNVWPMMQTHHISHNFSPNSCFPLVHFSFLPSKYIQY